MRWKRNDKTRLGRSRSMAMIAASVTLLGLTPVTAGGFGGRAGGGNSRGANMARPAVRPSTSMPNFGGSRPNFSRPSVSRPNVSRPSVSRPSMTRPNVSRPSASRPSVQRPSMQRPSVQRPDLSRPNVSRPSMSLPNMSRPNVSRPNVSRPNVSRPDMSRPSGSRPDLSRPGISFPGISRPGVDRPVAGGGNRFPGNKLPDVANKLPGNRLPGNQRPSVPSKLPGNLRPGGDKPGLGDLGDFLGLDRPLRPEGGGGRPTTLPGTVPDRPIAGRPKPDRPSIDRPSLDRPAFNRPDVTFPNLDNSIGGGNRPSIDIGEINLGNNTIINNRPSWANIDRDSINQINNRWSNNLVSMRNWQDRYPVRIDRRRDWGDRVRDRWRYAAGGFPGYYRPGWWAAHPFRFCGWHYYYVFPAHSWVYWWSTPTYTRVTNWVSMGPAPASLSQPIYYDYGDGGNVTYTDNRVFIGGQEVAGVDEFAQSAADLATVAAPDSEEEAMEAEWLPLGTFALTTDPDDIDVSRTIQLAVNKSGVISGTMFNSETEKADSIQGRVDKETQRVALRFGESEKVVAETGLYNLTQDEAPLLIHFGTETQDDYLLVRLPQPEEDADDPAAVSPSTN